MKKSINIDQIFTELPFYDRFEAVRKSGFDFLEFVCFPDKDLERIKELTEQFGLGISAFSGDKDYSMIVPEDRNGFLDYLSQAVETAVYLNCPNIVVHSDAINEKGEMRMPPPGLTYAQKFDSAVQTMTQSVKILEQGGRTSVLEALNKFTRPAYMTSTTQSGEAVRQVGSSYTKILYDVWHMQLMEGNIVNTLREYIDVIGYVHIGDAPERHEPGTGEINFTRVKSELKALGYDGFIGFELIPEIDSFDCAKKLLSF